MHLDGSVWKNSNSFPEKQKEAHDFRVRHSFLIILGWILGLKLVGNCDFPMNPQEVFHFLQRGRCNSQVNHIITIKRSLLLSVPPPLPPRCSHAFPILTRRNNAPLLGKPSSSGFFGLCPFHLWQGAAKNTRAFCYVTPSVPREECAGDRFWEATGSSTSAAVLVSVDIKAS